MYNLLNRFAWIMSFLIGMVVYFLFAFLGDWYLSEIAGGFLIGIFFGLIAKKMFFSSDFIQKAYNDLQNMTPRQSSSMVAGSVAPPSEAETNNVDELLSEAGYPSNVRTSNFVDPLEDMNLSSRRDDLRGDDVTDEPYVSAPREPSMLAMWIRSFFSERPLAKIGGILLFLGSLFFLYLIFDWVPPFGKVLIGLLFGFVLIGVGVFLDKKEIVTESRVLFGVGLAVNYLTILSARYFLGMGAASEWGFWFSDIATTVFFLLNTGLAVVLSLLYRSRVLLGFAFIFAYLIPFLVVSESQSSYLLTVYTTLITGAIGLISIFYMRMNQTENIKYLQMIAVVGMTALFSLSGMASESLGELVGVGLGLFLSVAILSVVSWKLKSSPVWIMVSAYIVIAILTLFGGSDVFGLLPFGVFGLLLLMLAYLWIGVTSTVFFSLTAVGIVLLSLGGFIVNSFFGFFNGGFSGIAHDLNTLFILISLILVVFGFVIFRTASVILGMIVGIGVTLILLSGALLGDLGGSLSITQLFVFKVLSVALLVVASIFTIRTKDAKLFLLSLVLSGVLILYPSMAEIPLWFLVFMGIFLSLSLLVPAILFQKSAENTKSPFLMMSFPISALIVVIATYQITAYYDLSGIVKGMIYLLEAVVYLGYACFFFRYFTEGQPSLSLQHVREEQKNTLLVLFALPLSFATFALGFIFHDYKSILSLAWIIESSILYMVYSRIKNMKIFAFASVIFLIGILQYFGLIGELYVRDFLALGTSLLALVAVFVGLVFLKDEGSSSRLLYDVLHLMSVIAVGIGISEIIPHTGSGWSLFGMIVFLVVVSGVYMRYGRRIQHISIHVALAIFILAFSDKFPHLHDDFGSLLIQWASLAMLLGIGYIGWQAKTRFGYINLFLSVIGFLLLSSLYVDRFFTTFAVSIYLTVIAAFLIIRGIVNDKQSLRTIGLYIGTFALGKIFFFDIWTQIDGNIVKVVALMFAGGLMVYLSQLYGKYVHQSWSEEFHYSHIFGGMLAPQDTVVADSEEKSDESLPFHEDLAKELRNISVKDVVRVEFVSLSGKVFAVERKSIIRLARYIVTYMKKDAFAPGELTSIYDRVIEHTQSNMKKEDLDDLLAQVSEWIASGGMVRFEKISDSDTPADH